MPLIPLAGRVSYLPGSNNLAVIATGDGGAIAVDSGIDKDTGRALRKALDEAGLVLRAIISTHHHADHVGGNAFLLRHYGPEVTVAASRLEAAFIQHPQLEPIYLSGGARPPAAMGSKFVRAPGSPVHRLLGGASVAPGEHWREEVAGVELTMIGLPGHSPAQLGVVVDGVCLAADGYFGPAVLAKHGVPYAHDIAEQLASLAALAELDAAWFVPGHGAPVEHSGLAEQLAANRAAVEGATELVRAALGEPGELGALTGRVLRAIGHSLGGPAQYAIFAGAVAAHLSYLEQQGQARLALVDEALVWSAV